MPRKSPRETSQSPASGSRRSSRIASLTKEEATPPRASRALAEPSKSPTSRPRRTPVKSPAKASPKTPTSQKRGQKRKSESASTPTSKRSRRGTRKQQEEEDEVEEEDEAQNEVEAEEADAGPSGDIAADDTKEKEKEEKETEEKEPKVEDEQMETEAGEKEAQIECPSIKITPPSEEIKPAVVVEEQPMETSEIVKPVDTSPKEEAKKKPSPAEPTTSDSRPDTDTTEQSEASKPQEVVRQEPEPPKDTPAATPEAEEAKEDDGSLEEPAVEEQNSAQEQVVPEPEQVTECKNSAVEPVVIPEADVKKDEVAPTKVEEQVPVTSDNANPATGEKIANDVKTVEETSEPTKEKVEVTNGQSDAEHISTSDATTIKESPQIVDSQSPGVISVGTN